MVGCSEGPVAAPRPTEVRAPDSEPTGPGRVLLAAAGAQAHVDGGRLYRLGPADLATDVDVVAVHQDFYGVPWDAFAAGEEPPAAWAGVLRGLAADARVAGKPVFLSAALVGGPLRAYLADRARENDGALVVDEGWSTRCFDFAADPAGPAMKAAWVRYVQWMVELFEPAWFNLGLEINLFASACGEAAWPGLVDAYNAGYEAVKALRPDIIAFPSVVLDHYYGVSADACPPPRTATACFDENLDRMAPLRRDRLGLSTYPYGTPGIASVADIPTDWFSRATADSDDRPLIAETGWNARSIMAWDGTACPVFRHSSESEQIAYFDRLIGEANALEMDLVAWWSNRDLLPADVMEECPCTSRPEWCAVIDVFRSTIGGDDAAGQYVGEVLFKFWGSMGLREYDGTPRAAFLQRWNEVRR
jgi:hypothetical protein